jgi:hypothetical protein
MPTGCSPVLFLHFTHPLLSNLAAQCGVGAQAHPLRYLIPAVREDFKSTRLPDEGTIRSPVKPEHHAIQGETNNRTLTQGLFDYAVNRGQDTPPEPNAGGIHATLGNREFILESQLHLLPSIQVSRPVNDFVVSNCSVYLPFWELFFVFEQ